jgi:hypothetical protein
MPVEEIVACEAVARWMIEHSYVTGHGDTLDDLLQELIAQAIKRAEGNSDARPARS